MHMYTLGAGVDRQSGDRRRNSQIRTSVIMVQRSPVPCEPSIGARPPFQTAMRLLSDIMLHFLACPWFLLFFRASSQPKSTNPAR